MTLKDHLTAMIRASGPMDVAEFMRLCLLHPTLGYYTTRTPFGVKGDFTTAPEISQMFGELIGLALAQTWMDQGAPARFSLVELGPGNGTLMADLMRATRHVPGFHTAAELYLLEASEPLKVRQKAALEAYNPQWPTSLDALPDQPVFLIANEFFDALPVQQFLRDGCGWRVRQVGLDGQDLRFGYGPLGAQPALAHRLEDTKDGDLVELRPAAAQFMAPLAARVENDGGAALIFDYGDWRSLGDTLQALQNHAPVDPLQDPGLADLTAHVDFEALVHDLPCTHSRLTTQGVFLERLGITVRAQALAQMLLDPARKTHIAAHRRLTHPDEMGALFKVIGLVPNGTQMLPGLEP